MKQIKTVFGFCLAAAFLLTGCESVVKEAKPPEQYLDSQVLDGNFIDFSNPEQIYNLYQAHYAAMQANTTYNSYSELRGGLDIFGIPTDWSKNFISFDIVDYDEEKGNLIYALITSNRTQSDSEYEYTADAEVTIGEDGTVQVTQKIDQHIDEDPFLIAAVGFYNQKNGKNQFFFIDKDYSAAKEDAGNGRYSLVVDAQDDTVAVFYKEEILFYHYNSSQKTYVLDEKNSYNMKNFYMTTSFVNSAAANGLIAEQDDSKAITLDLDYKIEPADGTIMTIDDQERMQSYMSALTKDSRTLADALLTLFISDYSSEQLSSYLGSSENWKSAVFNSADSEGFSKFLTCFDAVPIKGASTAFETFYYTHTLQSNIGAAPYKTVKIDTGGKKDRKDSAWLMASNDGFYFVPFSLQIVFSGETIRTYQINCEFYFKLGTGTYTSNADWNDAEFTIHDIRYRKDENGTLVPNWIQVEYSEHTAAEASKGTDSTNLMDRLQVLENSAKANVNQGTKWLDVNLIVDLTGKSYTVLANSQVEINSLNAISKLMDEERSRIKKDIEENNEKYRIHQDATRDITAKHLADLQTILTFAEENAEEETVKSLNTTKFSARFCKEDKQTDSEIELIADAGPGLLEIYQAIYDCQEKLKQQETYIKASQYLKINDVYDRMLDVMNSKLDDYTVDFHEEDKKKLQDALERQMVNRGLANSKDSVDFSVDEWMLPASMIGDLTDQSAWKQLSDKTMDDPEHAQLLTYLIKNHAKIKEKLFQTISDLEALHDLASAAASLTENAGSFMQTSEQETVNEDNFYTVGYALPLSYYKNAGTALEDICNGARIDEFREELQDAEDEDIQISRFDLEISEERKAELLAECDRMETLLKTIYTGSSDFDRKAAEEELNSRQWQIDVDCKVISGKIYSIQADTPTRTYYETIWSSTVNHVAESHNAYVFSDETTGLYFDESSSKVTFLFDAPPNFSTDESNYSKDLAKYFFGACEAIQGDEFLYDMDQAVRASVQYSEKNTSIYPNIPDNRCQIILLSQAEGRETEGQESAPRWSFMALPYSKLGLENKTTLNSTRDALEKSTDYDTLKSYGFISKSGINNEMSQTQNTAISNEEDETPMEYKTKIRGMLRDKNTIFLDNPKLDGTNPEHSRFYFLNLSLDEGIQLYMLNPEDGILERQNPFSDESLKNYTDGCWFMGWWYPDSDTVYNDQGNLSGGKLVLLGLTHDDMKTYSSEEDGSLRELVADDIYHSKLYEIHISNEQMNRCKK